MRKPLKRSVKLLIYKIALFALALLIAFSPANISRAAELENRMIVDILGIDRTERGYTVSCQALIPVAEAKQETTKEIFCVSGKSIGEALENLSSSMGKVVGLGHCTMVVIGEIDDATEPLEYLLTATELAADAFLVKSQKSAEEFLRDMNKFMIQSVTQDAGFLAFTAESAQLSTVTVINFLSDTKSSSKTSYMPLIRFEKTEGGGGGAQGQGQEQSGGGEEEKIQIAKLDTIQLFYSGIPTVRLDAQESRAMAWIDHRSNKGMVTLHGFRSGQTYIESLTGQMYGKSEKRKARLVDGEPVFEVNVKIKMRIYDRSKMQEAVNINGISENALETAVTNAFNSMIKEEIEVLYKTAKDYACDPLGIKTRFYRHETKFFKQNKDTLLENVKLKVNVDVVIK